MRLRPNEYRSKPHLEGQIDLERQDLFVDPEEERHGLGPAEEPGHVAAHALGRRHVVVVHRQVGLQELHHLVIDGVLITGGRESMLYVQGLT